MPGEGFTFHKQKNVPEWVRRSATGDRLLPAIDKHRELSHSRQGIGSTPEDVEPEHYVSDVSDTRFTSHVFSSLAR